MLVDYSDDVNQPWTTSYVSGLFNGTGHSVRAYYEWASWGQWTMQTDVVGWYVISAPVHGGVNGSCTSLSTTANQANAIATANGIDLTAYTNIVYWRVYDAASQNCGPSTGVLGGTQTWLWMDPTFCAPTLVSTSNDTGCNQVIHVPMHELGHNFGLDHAGALGCTDATTGVLVFDGSIASTNCVYQDYMNPNWSLMGGASGYATIQTDQKAQLGWIPASQVVTLTASATFTVGPAFSQSSVVYRVADGRNDCGDNEPQYQGTTYPNPPVDCYIYFENRAQSSFWDPTSWPTTGNLLAAEFGGYGFSRLLDGYPECSCVFDNINSNDPGLRIGRSYTLPNGVVVTNVAWDGVSNTVQVTFP